MSYDQAEKEIEQALAAFQEPSDEAARALENIAYAVNQARARLGLAAAVEITINPVDSVVNSNQGYQLMSDFTEAIEMATPMFKALRKGLTANQLKDVRGFVQVLAESVKELEAEYL